MPTHQRKRNNTNTKTNSGDLTLCCPHDNETYGEIIVPKGGGNFDVTSISGVRGTVTAKIVGSLASGPNRQSLFAGDIVIVQYDVTGRKYFITHKYSAFELKQLRKMDVFHFDSVSSVESVLSDSVAELDISSI